MHMDVVKLAREIMNGRRLKRGEDLSFFLTCDLTELRRGADEIRKHFCGNEMDLCTIINGRSGHCSENCKYCAQSAHHHTNCEVYGFLDQDKIVQAALANEKEGADRFAIVTSGRTLAGADFEKCIAVFKRMQQECKIELCASLGFLTAEQFHRLHQAGVTSYHENIETSRRYFPSICTTHTYEEKIETIKTAKKEGFCVCSGGIIGMGETWEDRLDMAISLAELGIESIPINALMPIPGTPLEHLPTLPPADILRTIAFFRYINPAANIRLAAGRKLLKNDGEEAFLGGASATITGNMLTTSGSTIKSDIHMLRQLGFKLNPRAPQL
jgi:biotin synthase